MLVQEHCIGLFSLVNGVLPIGMNRRVGAAQHGRTQLDTLGTHGKGSGHGCTVANTAGRNDRHLGSLANQGQEHHSCYRLWILKATAFTTLNHETIDTRIQGFKRHIECGYNVKHLDTCLLKLAGTQVGTARGCCDELDALLNHKINNIGSLHKR